MKPRNPERLHQQEDRESSGGELETEFWFEVKMSEAERDAKMRALKLGVKPAVLEEELPFDAKRDGLIFIDELAVNEGAVKRRVEQEPEFANWIKWDRSQSVFDNIALASEGPERYSERYHLLTGFLLGFPRWAVESYKDSNVLHKKIAGMDPGYLHDLGMFLDEGKESFMDRFRDSTERRKIQAQIDLLGAPMQKLVKKFYQEVRRGADFSDFIDRYRKQFEEFYRTTFKLPPNEVDRLLERTRSVVIKDPSGEGIMQFGAAESVPDLDRKIQLFQEQILKLYPKA